VTRDLPKLTPRQAQIVALLAEGLTQQQIGDRLGISRNTVKNHLYGVTRDDGTRQRGLYERIGADTKMDACIWGYHQALGLTVDEFMDRRRDERT
jgi:DNA-binding NarL/FixJ family response regulator